MRRSRFSKTLRSTAIITTFSVVLTFVIPVRALTEPSRNSAALSEPGVKHGQTQKLTPQQWADFDAAVDQQHNRNRMPHRVSAADLQRLMGRGYRNPYFDGSIPWHRALRDVDLCDGNLFKSFTDIQVSPGAGAGLVLQRTYNSNDTNIGPFGVGWTHAYDISMAEEPANNPGDASLNYSDKTDFFGGKHRYHRDADGLYSPPPYLYDELSSDYNAALVNGPISVQDDTDIGMDGTIKHYIANGSERDCDYIQDRFGNRTSLTYGDPVILGDGTLKNLLTQVMDPSGRTLVFSWSNLGTQQQPVYRITTVAGPQYSVTYGYGADQNLSSVTLDAGNPNAGHLNRTTSFGYTSVSGPNGTENGLLASIVDPLSHALSYTYTIGTQTTPTYTSTAWVSQVTEPGSNGSHIWTISSGYSGGSLPFSAGAVDNDGLGFGMTIDPMLRDAWLSLGWGYQYYHTYDSANNVLTGGATALRMSSQNQYTSTPGEWQVMTYGQHGNMLTSTCHNDPTLPHTTYTYYNASQYFQKASVTDENGRTTTFGVGSNNDPNPGNRGNVLWVQDAGYNDPNSPSFQKQFVYTYFQNGQKASEVNLNNVATVYTYGDIWGNLTGVVQDPGAGHLNRTTLMSYDPSGHVLSSTSPANLTSQFGYNLLGQPTGASFPANGAVPGETITYQYGGNGRTTAVADNRGVTTLTYENGNDRVSSVADPVTGSVGYTYGMAGERLTMTLPGGGTFLYSYAGNGNQGCILPKDDPNSLASMLTHVTDDQGRRVDYWGDLLGRPFEVYSDQTAATNGSPPTPASYVYTTYAYDIVSDTGCTHNWLAEISNSLVVPGSYGRTITTTLSKNDYTYDPTGQRLTNTIQDNTGAVRTEQYGYDDLNRLGSVNYGDGQTQGYTFDPMGNRSSKTDAGGGINGTENYSYNNANMLLSRAGNAYTNDANGNTLSGAGRVNTWDSENRLVQCVGGGNTSQFTYAADGIRHRSVVNGTTTDFVLDASMFVRELRGGVAYATYLMGATGPMYRRDATTGNVSWYLFDGLGSVIAEVNPSGTVTSSRKYDVYGSVRGGNNPSGTSAHKFVGALGHASDDNTGMIYMQARYMDPVTGRFESEDPAHSRTNWFTYVASDPTNLTDSSGCIAQSAVNWIIEILQSVGISLTNQEIKNLLKKGSTYALSKIQDWIDEIAGASEDLIGETAKALYNEEEGDEILPGAGAEFAADAAVCGPLSAEAEVAVIYLEQVRDLIALTYGD